MRDSSQEGLEDTKQVESYIVDVIYTNCGYEGPQYIPKGTTVREHLVYAECSNCGCSELAIR